MIRTTLRAGLLLVMVLAVFGLVVYRARSAGAPGMGLMNTMRGMMAAGDTDPQPPEGLSPEAWAQMQAMMPAMADLMDQLAAAPDEATAATIRQQLLAMMTVMHDLMGEGAPADAEAMLATMEQMWPMMAGMGGMMPNREERPLSAEEMAAMMATMGGMMRQMPATGQ